MHHPVDGVEFKENVVDVAGVEGVRRHRAEWEDEREGGLEGGQGVAPVGEVDGPRGDGEGHGPRG